MATSTTILMLKLRIADVAFLEVRARWAYNTRVNRGADQLRRWDFYKLCAQAGGKR